MIFRDRSLWWTVVNLVFSIALILGCFVFGAIKLKGINIWFPISMMLLYSAATLGKLWPLIFLYRIEQDRLVIQHLYFRRVIPFPYLLSVRKKSELLQSWLEIADASTNNFVRITPEKQDKFLQALSRADRAFQLDAEGLTRMPT